jgi:hypothetical protein
LIGPVRLATAALVFLLARRRKQSCVGARHACDWFPRLPISNRPGRLGERRFVIPSFRTTTGVPVRCRCAGLPHFRSCTGHTGRFRCFCVSCGQAMSPAWWAVSASLCLFLFVCFFSVCFCSCCFLLPFSGVLPCSCQCAGGLWFVVSVFHATRALPLCILSCLRLAACPALRRRQSCLPDWLFLCFS